MNGRCRSIANQRAAQSGIYTLGGLGISPDKLRSWRWRRIISPVGSMAYVFAKSANGEWYPGSAGKRLPEFAPEQ